MLWTIVVVLVVIWLIGLLLDVVGGLIHILLVVAAIVLIYNFIKGRKT